MKKITFALAACVVFAFAACGGNNTEGTTNNDSAKDSTATEAAPAPADTTVKADSTATAAPAADAKAEKK